METHIHRFIKKPNPGDKVKVYLEERKFCFGIVTGVEIDDDWDEKNANGYRYKTEVAILNSTEEKFTLAETDYFLPSTKVRFAKPSEN